MSTDVGRIHHGNEPLPTEPLTVIKARWKQEPHMKTYVRLDPADADVDAGITEVDVWFCIEDRVQWDLEDVLAEWRIVALPIDQINQEAFHAAAH
jgi:hypothetical protein